MNIQQFQYILAVVELRNFEAAADRCCVTQSTLSTMIRRFESEIGIKIFNRKNKPVTITSEGQQIIDRLRVINNEVESLENVIQELKGEMVGELRIGVIPTIAPYVLPSFLSEFAAKFPRVNIVVKEMTTSQIRKDLKGRMLDIGLLAIPIGDEELDEHPLYSEPFLLYSCEDEKPADKIKLDDLDYSKLCLLQEGHCLRSQVRQICELYDRKCNTDSNFIFESGSMDSLLRFTKANKGFTIIPYLASLDLPREESCNFVEFIDPVPVRSVGLLTHKYFVKHRMLEELRDMIREKISVLLPESENVNVLEPV